MASFILIKILSIALSDNLFLYLRYPLNSAIVEDVSFPSRAFSWPFYTAKFVKWAFMAALLLATKSLKESLYSSIVRRTYPSE